LNELILQIFTIFFLITSNQIIIAEYDDETDKELEVTYTIDPEVELKNVNALKDISVGDSVDIEYVVRNGKKVAKVIAVEKPSEAEEQQEYTPSETYEKELEYPSEEIEY